MWSPLRARREVARRATADADVLDAPAPRGRRRRPARLSESGRLRRESGGSARQDERRRVSELATRCPKCEQVGAAVDRITLKALLTPDGLRRGVPKQPHCCPTVDCPVVYFDLEEALTSRKA